MRSWFKAAMGSSTAAACMGLASAQTDYVPTESTPSTYSSPSSTAANQSLTAPRTGIYDIVTDFNAAADNTVDDYLRRPSLINGQQFFAAWGGPTLVNGAFSFNSGGLDWFGSVNGTDAPALFQAGLAKGGAWGAGLMLALAKASYDVPGGDQKTVLEGDGFGLFGNLSLGNNSDIYGRLGLFTDFDDAPPEPDNYLDNAAGEIENRLIDLLLGWKRDAAGEGSHALNAELGFDYGMHEEPAPGPEASLTRLSLGFFHGYILKENPTYDVFLGSNSTLLLELRDVDGPPADPSRYAIFISPNIAFQKTLMWGFEGFAGAQATLGWEKWDDAAGTLPGGPVAPGGATSSNVFFTSGGGATLGLRWVKDNLAIEGSLSDTFLSSGPNFIGGGTPGFLTQVGLALGI